MKTKSVILIALLFLGLWTLDVGLALAQATNEPATTNSVPVAPPAVEATLKPLLELLGGKGTILTTIIAWFAAISAALAPFAVWIRNKLADALNSAAESASGDDDTYLRKLFGNPAYRFAAFVLNFANIRLPTLAELERALELQKEAAAEKEPIKP